MDYKKKYEMALERAKEELGSGCFNSGSIEYIFPELKKESESEDEKIRNQILDCFRTMKQQGCFPSKHEEQYNSWINWLEKQKSVDEIVKRYKESWYNEGKIAGQVEGLTADERYWQGWHDALEKQGGQSKEVTYTHEVETGNGNIRALVTEKHKFNAGDRIVSKYGDLFQIKEVVAGCYKLLCPSGNEEINSIHMVENNSHLWSIKDAKDGDVVVDKSDGTIGIFQSIGSAPDGGCCNDPSYCFLHCHYDGYYFYADFEDGNEIDADDLIPATKEQQKLLFEKITEAGYKWDAEEKVLNKIKMQDLVISENNMTKISDQDKWGDEDIKMLNTVINIFEKVYPSNYFTTFTAGSESPTLINSPEIVKWLKGIKQKALGKLKLTKEDLEALRIAIINLGDMAEVDAINNFNMTFGEAKEKLIEIKDRYAE